MSLKWSECTTRWRPPRLYDWLLVAALLMGVVWWLAPQNLPVLLYKLALVTLAGVVGYRLDRALFPYGRPHEWMHPGHHIIGVGCMLRRAIIVAAAMIGVTLGL
jgi:hypothetical protein